MRRFVYKKLIRDKILDHMLEAGEKPDFRVMDHEEYLAELKNKILEEGSELEIDAPQKLLSELADLQEVIDSMLLAIGKNRRQLREIQKNKIEKVGSFQKRVFVESVEIPDDNVWIKYMASNPERYQEIPLESKNTSSLISRIPPALSPGSNQSIVQDT